MLIDIVEIEHQITRVICLYSFSGEDPEAEENPEVELLCQGTPDSFQSIPKRNGFEEEAHPNVQLELQVRRQPSERFNEGCTEDPKRGVGELWIHRHADGNLLSFTIYISFEAADYVKSLSNFKAQFAIDHPAIRRTDKGEAYLVESVVFEGYSKKGVGQL